MWADQKTEYFVAATFDNLAGDMARGQGEHLSALAVLLGVPADRQAEFFALVQERYREFASRGEHSAGALIKALDEAMSRHPVFAKMSRAD